MTRRVNKNSAALSNFYLTFPSPKDVAPFARHGLYFSLEEAKVAFQLLARLFWMRAVGGRARRDFERTSYGTFHW
ncbi:hypothetical protein PMW02_04335 [Collinsella aerofaciens]|uniref:hypothetical protein n=1 Tax=Collinsella aerofaciens TaxID=74426 RepID=UPI0023302500|nr:hypothetical protein [Collinsella aerofaciens]MDB1803969.1 hypothetical protein [Collinsella aerofaciens]MDB1895202.1 hypothetical protein [Collinsella aerofaciens]MDB1901199.1 hypothetical protein [Collinsella aerofaciens]